MKSKNGGQRGILKISRNRYLKVIFIFFILLHILKLLNSKNDGLFKVSIVLKLDSVKKYSLYNTDAIIFMKNHKQTTSRIENFISKI